jgi:hypothetical protein
MASAQAMGERIRQPPGPAPKKILAQIAAWMEVRRVEFLHATENAKDRVQLRLDGVRPPALSYTAHRPGDLESGGAFA